MIIDAHQHFWKLDLPFDYGWLTEPQNAAIHRDFLPQHLEERIRGTGIDRTVFVQTQHNLEETAWALKLADENSFIVGVVGWVDLAGDDCEEQVLHWKEHDKFVGIRHVTQDEPDEDFIVRPDVLAGLRTLERHGVPFDLLFYVQHLKHAVTLARELPELPMVVDHLAKPRIKEAVTDGWIDDLRAASRAPNIFCKLSGMITEADWEHWKPEDLRPYVDAALEFFGPERCMFGSDWPVCELAGSYQQVHDALVQSLVALSDSEKASIFGKTAAAFYGLDAG